MPSQQQVEFANSERLRLAQAQAQAQSDAEIRYAREQAALQAERDSRLAGQQADFARQQAQMQAEQQAAAAQQNQQQMVLGAQLGAQRDYLGAQLQGGLAQQQAGFAQARDAQQHQYAMAQQQSHAELQSQLSQVQLNQQEQMKLRELERAATHTDQQVQAGYLSPEEGANLRTRIMTGLNPLQDRAQRADILRQQVATQALYDQNQQQAQLFAQRQERIAAGAAGNIQTVYNPDTGRNERYMVDINTGALSPLESSSIEQARQLALINNAQNINQSSERFPAEMQRLSLGNEALAQSTRFAAENQPLSLEHQALANRNLQQTINFSAQMQPGNVRHQQLVNDNIVQNLSQGAQLFPGQLLMQGAQLTDLAQRTQHAAEQNPLNLSLLQANVQIAQQHASQGPAAFRNQQEYQQAQTDMIRAHSLLYNAQAARQGNVQPLSPSLVNTITNQARTEVRNEIRDAVQVGSTRVPRWFRRADVGPEEPLDNALQRQAPAEIERRVQQRIGDLQRQQGPGQPQNQNGPQANQNQNAPQPAPPNAVNAQPLNVFQPSTPAEHQAFAAFSQLAQQVQALPDAQRGEAGQALDTIINLTMQYGRAAAMPDEARAAYTDAEATLRQLQAPAAPAQPAPVQPPVQPRGATPQPSGITQGAHSVLSVPWFDERGNPPQWMRFLGVGNR